MNYILSGEEQFLINNKLNEIIKNTLNDDINDMNVISYDFNNTTLEEVLADCNTIPFFSENKVVIYRNCTFLSTVANKDSINDELLLSYLEKPNLSTVLILCVDGLNIDSRKKLVKSVSKLCKLFKFSKIDEFAKTNFINDELKRNNVTIDREGYKLFVDNSSYNFNNIRNDITKLAIYAEGKPLNKVDIEALVSKSIYDDDNIKFVWIEALYKGNAKAIFNIYNDFKHLNIEPLSLIGLIESQFRFLLIVKTYLDMGYSQNSIANELNAKPYRIQKTIENIGNFSSDKISDILNELAELDQKSKKGLIDINQGFELFLLNRCK